MFYDIVTCLTLTRCIAHEVWTLLDLIISCPITFILDGAPNYTLSNEMGKNFGGMIFKVLFLSGLAGRNIVAHKPVKLYRFDIYFLK